MRLGFVYLVFLPSILTTPLAGHAVRWLGTRPTMWSSLALAGLGLPLMLTPSLLAVLTGMVLVGVGTFFAQATATAFVGRAATVDRGAASGIYLACYFAGGLVGSAVLGHHRANHEGLADQHEIDIGERADEREQETKRDPKGGAQGRIFHVRGPGSERRTRSGSHRRHWRCLVHREIDKHGAGEIERCEEIEVPGQPEVVGDRGRDQSAALRAANQSSNAYNRRDCRPPRSILRPTRSTALPSVEAATPRRIDYATRGERMRLQDYWRLTALPITRPPSHRSALTHAGLRPRAGRTRLATPPRPAPACSPYNLHPSACEFLTD